MSLLSGATLVDATAAGRPLPLVADGNAHTALIPGPGPFSLTLEWGAPLTFAPGRASFVLPVPPAGTARATIDLPGEQADVRLSAGLITRRSVAERPHDRRSDARSGLGDRGVVVDARQRARSRPRARSRTLADVMTLVTLGDSDVRMVGAHRPHRACRASCAPSTCALPSGYELTGISGSSLESSEPRRGRSSC